MCLYIHIYLYIVTFFIGAIDGSHIRIDKQIQDLDSYINRKQYFSLHMQGTVNQNMKFIDVFVGFPGLVHDARVFKNSSLYRDLRDICEGYISERNNKTKNWKYITKSTS